MSIPARSGAAPKAGSAGAVPVICLPHAGAGASFFWPWQHRCPDLDLVPVQLPGREERIDEEPPTDLRATVDTVVADLVRGVLGRCTQVALFGHSLGAVLAYEVARRIEARAGGRVTRLFVSGSPAPDAMRERHATGLSDDDFLARVEEFAGFRHEAFDIPELREMLLPTIRADVELHESYVPLPGPRLRAPITCLRGHDDALVAAADTAGWWEASESGCETVELPGGHMYLADDPSALLRIMGERLAEPTGAVAR
ncbi:thioesterase II family protein [Frankia sp. R43]|uniref:thioesterase II family protein n=1 Tax=Frankia sp. R43 TaxID=269536 RepID=UPI000A84A605|nr:alpha/beta fold hydrolase [Frankia sp. R43]